MKRLLLTLAACGFALGANARAAEPAAHDVFFFADKRPLRLRLHVLIDGRPAAEVYREAWDDYLKALFRHLDRNGDGVLDETEGQRLPPPSLQPGGAASRPTNLAFNFRVVDTNGDGKIDTAEVAAYYRDYGSAGIQLNHAPRVMALRAGDELFKRLDSNRDGRLTRDELAAAPRLMELDQDGDELLTAQEIAPRLFTSNVLSRRAVPPPAPRAGRAESQFLLVTPGSASEVLAARLRKRYGDEAAAQANRPADVELRVRLGQLQSGEQPLEVIKVPGPGVQARPTETGFALWLADSSTLIELHVNEGRPALVGRNRQQYLEQFHAADVGHKGYLTPRDAQMRNFYPQQFALLDRDLDGKLTERELLDYLEQVHERQARAVTSLVAVLASDAGGDLLDLLDRNRDGRLGLWELRNAGNVLGLVGKESFDRDTMPRSYHLAFGLCQAGFGRFGGHGTFTPRGLPMLALDWSRPELVWFHKMDRNRDGYVSLGEFLGPVEVFRKLDADGDGLISPEEALKAAGK